MTETTYRAVELSDDSHPCEEADCKAVSTTACFYPDNALTTKQISQIIGTAQNTHSNMVFAGAVGCFGVAANHLILRGIVTAFRGYVKIAAMQPAMNLKVD